MSGLLRGHGRTLAPGTIVAWRSIAGDWRGRVAALRSGGQARVEVFKPQAGAWRPDGTVIDLPVESLRVFVEARVAYAPGTIEARGKGDDTELFLYGDIGEGGITAAQVAAALRGRDPAGRLVVYLSSPGGNPFEGVTIASNIARWRGRSTVYIDGLAASAATLIAVSAAQAIMSPDAMFMIHRASTLALGDRNDMQHTLEVLDRVDAVMAGMYARKTGLDAETLLERMSAEWWMDADTARKFKFVDAIAAPPQRAPGGTTAMLDRPWFARLPLGARPAGTQWPLPAAVSSSPSPSGLQSTATVAATSHNQGESGHDAPRSDEHQ